MTYERILRAIDEIYLEDVRHVLTVFCFSIRPLIIRELIDVARNLPSKVP
jgi:hypothetical protein